MVERVELGYEGFMRKVGFAVEDCVSERKFLNIFSSMLSSAKRSSHWTNEIKASLVQHRFGLGGVPPEPIFALELDFGVCRQRINQVVDSVVAELRTPENVEKFVRKN